MSRNSGDCAHGLHNALGKAMILVKYLQLWNAEFPCKYNMIWAQKDVNRHASSEGFAQGI